MTGRPQHAQDEVRGIRRARPGARPPRLVLVLLASLPLVPVGEAPAQPQEASSFPAITAIEVRREDVFSPSEEALGFFPYGLANVLHAVTKEKFIRRELLLSVGDPLDPDVLAEAERRLRATRLFRRVRVRSEGTTVVVETGDNWTLLPRFSYSNKGGVITYQVGLEEQNLLGTGRGLAFKYDSGTERISRSLAYDHPQLFGSRIQLHVAASDLSDGQAAEASLARPFDSLTSPRAFWVYWRQENVNATLWTGGEESAVWKRRERGFSALVGRLSRATRELADRWGGLVQWEDVSLQPGGHGPPPPPDDRKFLWIGGGIEREARGWIERQDVEQIGRDEDFNLAPGGRIDLSVSAPVFGARTAGRVRVNGSTGRLLPAGFTIATLAAQTRIQGGPQNALVEASIRGWWMAKGWTLASRIGVRNGWRIDPEKQLVLDGENGVRGYRLHAVAGTGNTTANVELRRVLVPDVLKLASLGMALFGDAGYSWGPPDGGWRLADAGVGFRVGLPRAGKNVLLRIDVARAFHPDPLGRSGWLLSFSSGQAF